MVIANKTGKALQSVGSLHKYTDNYKNTQAWGVAADSPAPRAGARSSPMSVDGNTGLFATGSDWWLVTWQFQGDRKIYHTNPDNFRSLVDALEPFLKTLIQILIHADSTVEWHSPSGISTTVSGVYGELGLVDFSGDCGEGRVSGQPMQIASERGLQPQDQVSVNGSTDLSACLVGNDNARVFGINMKTQDGGRMYDDVINVDARGPEGFGSGSLYLAFTDESGDTYYLSIYSSSRSTHTLKYNSNKPAIKRIFWSNYRFSV